MLAVAALGGCQAAPWKRKGPPPGDESSAIARYLQVLGDVASGDAALQADAYYDAEQAYIASADLGNMLLYGLVLAVPGHPSSNPAEARSLLVQALAEPTLLSPEERNLARVGLQVVQERLVLLTGSAQTQEQMSGELARQRAASERRIGQLTAEVQRLSTELAEAQAKLDAVATIERTLENPENGN
jgi:hypothetical protein